MFTRIQLCYVYIYFVQIAYRAIYICFCSQLVPHTALLCQLKRKYILFCIKKLLPAGSGSLESLATGEEVQYIVTLQQLDAWVCFSGLFQFACTALMPQRRCKTGLIGNSLGVDPDSLDLRSSSLTSPLSARIGSIAGETGPGLACGSSQAVETAAR